MSRCTSSTLGLSKYCFNIPYNPSTHNCQLSGYTTKKPNCPSMPSAHVCCSGRKYRRKFSYSCCMTAYVKRASCNSNMLLCANNVYNSAKSVCCLKSLVKSLRTGYACCLEGYARYPPCTRLGTLFVVVSRTTLVPRLAVTELRTLK